MSVEPSGSLMLGHGTINVLNDETHNQDVQDWDNAEGDGEQVYGGELNEEGDEYESEKYERAEKFSLKNGCCRECMKAFSKTGKVSTQEC